MNLLLISAPIQASAQQPSSVYPLGLAYLHAVLTRAGHSVTTRDWGPHSEEVARGELYRILRGPTPPDALLVQVWTMSRVSAYSLMADARKLRPSLWLIGGGIHATIFPTHVLAMGADTVIKGEAEEILPWVLERGTRGIVEGTLVCDLDSVPEAAHHVFLRPHVDTACVMTTRGCPFKCSFCCLHVLSQRKYRMRSPQSVVEELQRIRREHPYVRRVMFADDTFTLNQDHTIELCEEIARADLGLTYICSGRVKPASRALFDAMVRAGVTDIGFGIETGSRSLLRQIGKGFTPEDVLETMAILRDSPLRATLFLMVGFPGESRETVDETIELLRRIRAIRPVICAGAVPVRQLPATDICRTPDDYWLTDGDVPLYDDRPEWLLRWWADRIGGRSILSSLGSMAWRCLTGGGR